MKFRQSLARIAKGRAEHTLKLRMRHRGTAKFEGNRGKQTNPARAHKLLSFAARGATFMSVRKILRASFVVTISVAAPSACSGKVEESKFDNAADSGIANDGGNDGGQVTCPTSQPTRGQRCSGSGVCNYGAKLPPECGGGYGSFAECRNGVWELGGQSCNPPAPVCPTSFPKHGDPCLNEGQSCDYANGPCPKNHAECASGRWVAVPLWCNPPPPDAGLKNPVDAGEVPMP